MIILTGGAGFIGSCFLKTLNANGIYDVIVVDRLGTADKWKNLVGKRFAGYYHKNEFFDVLLENTELSRDIDAIVHLGACSSTTESDVDYIMSNNLNYSINLGTYAAEHNIKFIYASSAATYGDGSNGYSDSSIDGLRPLNPYGFSKHLFDQWVMDNELDTEFTGVKFFNVFGPNEYHKGDMASMIFKSFNQIMNTGKVSLFKSNSPDFKDGEQKRDFVYVKDATNVLWNMLENKNTGGIFNLGTGKARTWNDLVAAVFNALGRETNIEYIDMPGKLEGKYQNFTQADIRKLKASPFAIKFTELEDAVHDYVANYLNKSFKNI
jgi:ADP-L-glycero-D-manno-heptose 6-epimerase